MLVVLSLHQNLITIQYSGIALLLFLASNNSATIFWETISAIQRPCFLTMASWAKDGGHFILLGFSYARIYNFKIMHCKGSANINADALSWLPCALTVSLPPPELLQTQLRDPTRFHVSYIVYCSFLMYYLTRYGSSLLCEGSSNSGSNCLSQMVVPCTANTLLGN